MRALNVRVQTGAIILSLFTLLILPAVHLSAAATQPDAVTDYPADPTQDIPWKGGFATLADVESAFNFARSTENAQISVFNKQLVMPSATAWAAKSDGEKVLWLVNEERTARGLAPLDGLEKNANEVAQAFAEWLLAHNAFDHKADGSDPKARLNTKPAINACHDSLDISENLAWQGTTSPNPIPFVVEKAVYDWMYADSNQALPWGHRHAILWTPYNDNSGAAGSEGFIGFGRARGAYTFTGVTFPNTEMLVLNFFDPCATWQPAAAPVVPSPPAPVVTVPTSPPGTRTATGVTRLPVWQTIESQPFEPATWPDNQWLVDEIGDGDYRWIPSTCRVFAGTYSAMALGGGVDGSKLACNAEYPAKANSWLIYGPFDLTDAVMADFSTMVWVYTEPEADFLCLTASTDRKLFNGPCVSGASVLKDEQGSYVGWVQEQLDLNRVYQVGSLLGKTGLYVALVFQTNGSVSRQHMGVYADDVVLRKAVLAAGADAATGDATGQPLYGVRLTDQTGQSVMSNNDGGFNLLGLTPGLHTLTPSRPGYLFYPSQVVVDVSKQNAQNLSFIAVNAGTYRLTLPLLQRTAPRTQSAADDAPPLTRTDSTFVLDCTAAGCTMLGPLP